jgi:hypothetical protein
LLNKKREQAINLIPPFRLQETLRKTQIKRTTQIYLIMNPILLDFEKLFATIKNPKNNFSHLKAIHRMVQIFERKYKDDFEISTSLLIKFINIQYKVLELKLYKFEQNKEI